METPKQLIDCLNQNKVQYEILHHAEAVTAQRIAQAEHVKGRHQAKVVMLKSGDQHLIVVLPADHHIDLEKIEKAIGKPVSSLLVRKMTSTVPGLRDRSDAAVWESLWSADLRRQASGRTGLHCVRSRHTH